MCMNENIHQLLLVLILGKHSEALSWAPVASIMAQVQCRSRLAKSDASNLPKLQIHVDSHGIPPFVMI